MEQIKETPTIIKKIGKTTYVVKAHFNESATESMGDKIKRMLRKEIEQGAISGEK